MLDVPADNPIILVTGFVRSPGDGSDPSGDLLQLLAADPPGGVDLRTQLLPIDWESALLKAIEAMDRLFPDAVIGLGLAEGQPILCVERVAINLNDRETPVREGRAGRSEPIDAAGPAAYFSTLPVHSMVERMRAGGIAASVSNSAGAQLSNRLFYALLHYVSLRGQETWFKKEPPAGLTSRIGFIRLPASPRPAAGRKKEPPALALETSLRGVSLAIEAVTAFLASPGAKAAAGSSATE